MDSQFFTKKFIIKQPKITKMSTKATDLSVETTTDLTQYTQANIPGMLAMVTEKIKSLKGTSPKTSSTKGKHLPGFGPVEDLKTVESLLRADSSVTGKAAAYKAAAERHPDVNIAKFPFKIEGCSEKQWIDAITANIALVKNKVELDKLIKTKSLLEANLSAEAKLAADLKKIADLIAE